MELSLDKRSFMCIGHISQRHPEINRVTPKNESDEDEMGEDNEALALEISQLIYHLQTLMLARGLTLQDIYKNL